MKTTALVSLLFAGAALAVPVVEKRGVDTEVVVTTIWTTTTVFVDGPTGAAFFEKRPRTSSSSSLSSSTSAPAPPPSSAAPAPSVAPAVPSVAPPAAPSAAPVAAPVAAAPDSGSGSALLSYTGEATYYSVSNGAAGSCGITKTDNDNVVALSHLAMKNGANSNNNALCGKTVTIQGETGSFSAVVYDTCEGCAVGDIDVSPSLFKAAFPHGDGRVKGVKWSVSG